MQPLAHAHKSDWLKDITTIATDIDGTLTNEDGHFSAELIRAFEVCLRASIRVLLVTGRPASWVQGMVEYLPVVGGIGENGGIYCPKQKEADMRLLMVDEATMPPVSLAAIEAGRLGRLKVFERLKEKYPQLVPTGDCVTRLTDFTFPLGNLSHTDLADIETICSSAGYGFTYSSIHGHIKHPDQHKASGILKTIRLVPELKATVEQVITVGDSRNDQEMFDHQLFPYSVGVANIARHVPHMAILPQFVTIQPGVLGFCELVEQLLAARS